MSGMVVRPISTTDAVVASLREQILDGDIAPGTPLPEIELASTYGVARPTVRAAIQTLCHLGLLVREPNRSAHVPALTPEAVRDIFFARIPLECFIVRTVIERKAPLDGVRESMARMESLPASAGWSQVVEADLAFHAALARAVGSPRLERLHGSLAGDIQLCVAQLRPAWGTPAELGREHHEVFDVISTGTAAQAEARMTAHLERAVRDLTLPRPEPPPAPRRRRA
jgi:DNA-binding GntR family transcriptional regulator